MGLGMLKYVHDKTQFIVLSFVWKFFCGLGAGINTTSSFAIIARHYKHDRERTIGMMESSSGFGLLLGPFFGAILYEIGGYMMPFIVFCKNLSLNILASFYLCLYPLIAYTLIHINDKERETPQKESEVRNPEISEEHTIVKVSKLCLIPRFLMGVASQVMVYSSVTFLQPILALHLEKFGYTASFIGLSFAIPTLIYAATSPLVYVLTSKIRKSGVIFIGYAILTMGTL